MSQRPLPLPRRLEVVEVPPVFAASKLFGLERCALSVIGTPPTGDRRAAALLPPHPLALLGTALHQARASVLEGAWGEAASGLEAFRSSLAASIEEMEAELTKNPDTARLVPLRVATGRREWMARIGEAERWASQQTGRSRKKFPRLDPLSTDRLANGCETSKTALGAEKSLYDPELRLIGRPDWTETTGLNGMLVSEFKSGRIFDKEGELRGEYTLQVRSYALLLERARPGINVEVFVEGAERVPVAWGDAERSDLVRRIRRLHERLPAGQRILAAQLANPGTHCRDCRLRAICPSYLDLVSAWWADGPGMPRPLPLDMWGVVQQIEQDERGHSITLTDAIGRQVLVDGLEERIGCEKVTSGDLVWFFNLEASEDLDQHGIAVHPRNFHQIPPGRRWSTAKQLRVFVDKA